MERVIYEYKCPAGHQFDVIKSLADIDRPEPCPDCHEIAARQISLVRIDKEAAGGWNQQSWNPALGQWTKSTKEARRIAKSRGMEEVGTEPVDNLHKAAEKRREEIREERWKDADRDKLYS